MEGLDERPWWGGYVEMVVVEKLRAICQQMREYEFGRGRARARDFYDIHLARLSHQG